MDSSYYFLRIFLDQVFSTMITVAVPDIAGAQETLVEELYELYTEREALWPSPGNRLRDTKWFAQGHPELALLIPSSLSLF